MQAAHTPGEEVGVAVLPEGPEAAPGAPGGVPGVPDAVPGVPEAVFELLGVPESVPGPPGVPGAGTAFAPPDPAGRSSIND